MKKLLTIATIAAIAMSMTGCHTRIVAEKYPEKANPIQRVVTVDGKQQLAVTDYRVTSGGGKATARSPLWATESLDGLSIGVMTNGTVTMALQHYNRDLSTNATIVVNSLTTCAADIAGKVAGAIVAYYGGGAVSATSQLGSLTIKDIVGKVQTKLQKSGVTDATASTVNTEAVAKEVTSECVGDACSTCTDGSCAK